MIIYHLILIGKKFPMLYSETRSRSHSLGLYRIFT